MSDSVRPHRRQPTRLPCPWDSPGKNTGVGCHFLLQCVKVKSESEVAQLCPTLSDPMDCSPPGSSIHGIFQARVLEWLSLPSPGRGLRGKRRWPGKSGQVKPQTEFPRPGGPKQSRKDPVAVWRMLGQRESLERRNIWVLACLTPNRTEKSLPQ